ncbi:MAG: entericidin A/B family lipoprotein [Halothiobacillaceae bacterium]
MKFIPAMVVLAVSMLLAACNTLEGVGKDIQSGGQAIERAAQ